MEGAFKPPDTAGKNFAKLPQTLVVGAISDPIIEIRQRNWKQQASQVPM